MVITRPPKVEKKYILLQSYSNSNMFNLTLMFVNFVNTLNHCPGAVSLTSPVLVQLASQAGAVTRTDLDGALFDLSRGNHRDSMD